MGFISRRVLPGCGSMFVCCPALRPSSRQPVKRYKKLLAEIFPKRVVSFATGFRDKARARPRARASKQDRDS